MARTRWVNCVLLALLLLTPSTSWSAPEEPEKILPPEDLALRAPDGTTIVATYYPSKLGKKAVPVILLHGAKGSRADFESLAKRLQKAGQAVIAPDLRGHGESMLRSDGSRITDLRFDDYEAMLLQDMETIKRFLMVKNNAGELNIEKLGIVAIDSNCVVAINWAAHDWSWPPLTTGKQGQDIKALALISPEFSVKGMRTNEALVTPAIRFELSAIIVVGKSSKQLPDTKRIYTALENHRPGGSGQGERQSLFFRTPNSALHGTRLLREKSLGVEDAIATFIDARLVKMHAVWNQRKLSQD